MFTQAGFNKRRRTVCFGFIMRHEWQWFRASRMVRFASGEFAWDGGGGRISWPEQVAHIGNQRAIQLPASIEQLPYSRLPA